jgi:DNA-binding XRE family transcriptional regulator
MAQFYTTIIHPVRKALHLSCNEYCVLDTILRMQNNDSHWCYMSRETMADDLDLSKQSILNILKGLIARGLVVKHEKTSHLRCVGDFKKMLDNYKEYGQVEDSFTDGKESLPEESKKFTLSGKENLPNNTINNKRTFIIPTASEVSSYGKEIGFNIDGEYFCDHYEARGWKLTSGLMKDWKAAVRVWKRNQGKFDNKPNQPIDSRNVKIRPL